MDNNLGSSEARNTKISGLIGDLAPRWCALSALPLGRCFVKNAPQDQFTSIVRNFGPPTPQKKIYSFATEELLGSPEAQRTKIPGLTGVGCTSTMQSNHIVRCFAQHAPQDKDILTFCVLSPFWSPVDQKPE